VTHSRKKLRKGKNCSMGGLKTFREARDLDLLIERIFVSGTKAITEGEYSGRFHTGKVLLRKKRTGAGGIVL